MRLFEAIEIGICEPEMLDVFLQHRCPLCGYAEVDVEQDYGPDSVRYYCHKCGHLRTYQE